MSVETIAVIGSGLMGRGIAYAAAVGGFRTVAPRRVRARPSTARFAQIRKDLDEGVARGKLTADAGHAPPSARLVRALGAEPRSPAPTS